jgi:peroxiredoxin
MNSRALITGVLIVIVAGVAGFLMQRQFTGIPNDPVILAQSQSSEKSLTGTVRPDFSLPDKDGNMRSVREWDGKVLVINFWATWCPPCRDEIPEFIKLQNEYGEQGLQFIGIALQKAEEVQEFAAELGMNYPILVGEQTVIKVAENFGNTIGILPYTVVVDRNQKIVFIKKGPLHYDEADAVINPLF